MSSTAKAIRKARLRRELTQKGLADAVGVVTSTVSGWEAGTHGVRLDHLKKLAVALGVEVGELVA